MARRSLSSSWALGGALLVALLLAQAAPISLAQYVIVDLSSARIPPGSGSSSLPERVIGLSAADFGGSFPTSPPKTVGLMALPLANQYGCSVPQLPGVYPGSLPLVLLVRRGGNCTFVVKAQHAQAARAVGVLVVAGADDDVFQMSAGGGGGGQNATDDVAIPAAMISFADGDPLIRASLHDDPKAQNNAIEPVLVHTYARATFDLSFVFMLLLATAVVMYGAYLSSAAERRARRAHLSGSAEPERAAVPGEGELEHQYLDQRHALGFIFGASAALLILFFFIQYLIYVLIALFCVASLQAVTHLGTVWLRWLHPSYTRTVRVPVAGEVSVYTLCSFVAGLVMTVTWAVQRNAQGAWLLQDVLGVSLLLVIQQSLRLPDIKVSSVLLCMAFVYDVFWVFLSAYIFRSSVMMSVARGGDTGEAVPMLLRLPRFSDELGGYSMLGLGDMALPGLLVAYLLRFDLQHAETATRRWWQTYFAIASGGYAAGLVLTYVALMVSESGQPALLYLVPTTLGVVLPVAFVRGDLREMWSGSHARSAAAAGGGSAPSSSSSGLTAPPRSNGQYAAVSSLNSAPESDLVELQLQDAEDVDASHLQDDEREMMNAL